MKVLATALAAALLVAAICAVACAQQPVPESTLTKSFGELHQPWHTQPALKSPGRSAARLVRLSLEPHRQPVPLNPESLHQAAAPFHLPAAPPATSVAVLRI